MDFFSLSTIRAGLNKIDCVATFPPIPTLRTSGKRKLSTPCTYNENTPANKDNNRYFIVKILYGFYLLVFLIILIYPTLYLFNILIRRKLFRLNPPLQ